MSWNFPGEFEIRYKGEFLCGMVRPWQVLIGELRNTLKEWNSSFTLWEEFVRSLEQGLNQIAAGGFSHLEVLHYPHCTDGDPDR